MSRRIRRLLAMGVLGERKPFDYYVDSVNGDDGNDGLSSATAFATISALTGKIAAGKRIGLARGSTWREQLTIAANNVTVRAYGTGNMPLLDASDIALKSSISKTALLTNVYEISVSLAAVYSEQFVNCYEDNVSLVRVASTAVCDATPGSYYPSAEAGDITLYIHASDSSDVSANAKVYEYTARNEGINAVAASGTTIDGVRCRRNLFAAGSFNMGASSRVLNCTAEDGNSHCIQVGEGSYLFNVTAKNLYNGSSTSSLFNYYQANPTGKPVTFDGCTAENDAYISTCIGFSGHIGGVGSLGKIHFINCTAKNVLSGWTGSGASEFVLENCQTLTKVDYGVQITTQNISVIGGNWVVNSRICLFSGAGLTATFSGLTAASSGIGFYSAQENTTLSIEDCDITNKTYHIDFTKTGCTLTSLRNVFDPITTVYLSTEALTLTSDYNVFTGASTGNKFKIAGTDYTFDAYKTATGQDAHSTAP